MGYIPFEKEVFMIFAYTFEMMGAISWRTFGGMLFGPTALEESMSFIIDSICSGEVFLSVNLAGFGALR